MNRAYSSILTVSIVCFISAFSPDVTAAPPGKCDPWPSCKNGDGGGDTGGGAGGPPAPIEDITTDAISNAVSLSWIVPDTPAGGSDIHHYDVRFSKTALDAGNFETVGSVAERSEEFLATGPGEVEYFTVRDLVVDTPYYFGVRAVSSSGDVSELTAGSFSSSQTLRTASDPGLWQVDDVTELAEDSNFGCCASMSAQFDELGNPTVAWTRGFPDEVRFAYRDESDNWTTEVAFAGTNCQACSMGHILGFRYEPTGAPGVSTPATPALLFRHMVEREKKRKGNFAEESLVYAYRRGPADWVAEEVVRGDARENNGIDGYPDRFAMDHFWVPQGESGIWVPTAAYITTPLWEDPDTVYELAISERSEDQGQGAQWNATGIFSCNAADARIRSVQLQRGSDGSLHAMVPMSNASNLWVTLLHRPADGTPIQYWQSDLFVGEAFNVDSQGNYYVAGRTDWDAEDLVLIESTRGAFQSIDKDAVCSAPNAPQGGREVVELGNALDTFYNDVQEGALIGTHTYSGGWGLELTGDDGESAPAVHIFKRRSSGNYEINEFRVFSRCFPGAGWIWDAVDRPHASEDWRNVAVSDSAMAWAYNFGAVFGGRYESFPQDQMLLAERTGHACLFQ